MSEVLRKLRHDRDSRRNILLSWNPTQVDECVLPPCHCMAQFRVLNRNELHCHMTQRSADYALGVPYNIASYALLTHILAKLSGLEATRLIVSFGDAHIYEPHWVGATKQMTREPYPPPRVEIDLPDYDPDFPIDLQTVSFSSLRLLDYSHHSTIKYEICP